MVMYVQIVNRHGISSSLHLLPKDFITTEAISDNNSEAHNLQKVQPLPPSTWRAMLMAIEGTILVE